MWKKWEQLRCVVHSTPDSPYDKSNIGLIGNVYCPNTMCSDTICVYKETLQSLERSGYQGLQCSSTCQMRNIPFEEQTESFFMKFGQGNYFLKRGKKLVKMLLEMCIVQDPQIESVILFQKTKILVSTTVQSAKPALRCWICL